MTRWIDPSPLSIPASFADLNVHPLVAQTLVRRGITTPEAARLFLHPERVTSIPSPGFEPAVERIQQALRARELICVWGDFDVDGQSSTSVLVQTLQGLGANVMYYIPIRGKESHGLHIESLRPILDSGAQLILTCDTGITANEAIDYINSNRQTPSYRSFPAIMPRIFIPVANLRENQILITGEKARYLNTVLRSKKGDELSIFDGQGSCLRPKILKADKKELLAEV